MVSAAGHARRSLRSGAGRSPAHRSAARHRSPCAARQRRSDPANALSAGPCQPPLPPTPRCRGCGRCAGCQRMGNGCTCAPTTGRFGWVPLAALDVRVPGEMPVYDEAPPFPVRPFWVYAGHRQDGCRAQHPARRAGAGVRDGGDRSLLDRPGLYGRSADGQWLYGDGRRCARLISIAADQPVHAGYSLAELPTRPERGMRANGCWFLVIGSLGTRRGPLRRARASPAITDQLPATNTASSAERAQL